MGGGDLGRMSRGKALLAAAAVAVATDHGFLRQEIVYIVILPEDLWQFFEVRCHGQIQGLYFRLYSRLRTSRVFERVICWHPLPEIVHSGSQQAFLRCTTATCPLDVSSSGNGTSKKK